MLPEEYENNVVSAEDKKRAKEIVADMVRGLIEHSKHFEPKESGIKNPFIRTLARGG